jgi:hypothetical protein
MPTGLVLRTKDGNEIPVRFLNLGYDYTIMISHGNAEDIHRVEDWAITHFIRYVKANILIYEYTGYSTFKKNPSEKFIYSDAEAALWFLQDCVKIPLSRIILYGRSLGSGPSCYLASKYPTICGLIL